MTQESSIEFSEESEMINANTEQNAEASSESNEALPNMTEELLTEALKVEVLVKEQKTKEIGKKQITELVGKIADAYKTTNNIAYVGLCATLQAGGSNKNKRSNVKIVISNLSFESKKINEIISQQLKITPRQLARMIGNDIYQISTKHKITGNAYVSLTRFYSHLLTEASEKERYWAADFQVDNPNCPEYIREALRKRYADKFINRKT